MSSPRAASPVGGGTRGGTPPGAALRGWAEALAGVGTAWAAMAAIAALGLHLLRADQAGKLFSITSAVLAMAVGGSVHPTGNVSVFGMSTDAASAAIDLMPLGLSVIGAVIVAWFFVRASRLTGGSPGALLAHAAKFVVVFMAMLAFWCWAGADHISISSDVLSGSGSGSGTSDSDGGLLSSLGDLGKTVGGLSNPGGGIGFHVNIASSLLAGLVWIVVVLALTVLSCRRVPLPAEWTAVHRWVRPVASALVTVLLGAVVAGIIGGLVAAATGNGGGMTVGASLIGAPNAVWLLVPLGLGVGWTGHVSGPIAHALPSPLGQLMSTKGGVDTSVTLPRLAQLDGRVWLLPVAIGLMTLAVGVITAVRTPVASRRFPGLVLRVAIGLAVVLVALTALTGIGVNANLSVFGINAIGAGLQLHGSLVQALGFGLLWGAVAGGLGQLIAGAFPGAAEEAEAVPGAAFSTPPRRVTAAAGGATANGGGQPANPYAGQRPAGPPSGNPYGGPGAAPDNPYAPPAPAPGARPDNPYAQPAPAPAKPASAGQPPRPAAPPPSAGPYPRPDPGQNPYARPADPGDPRTGGQ